MKLVAIEGADGGVEGDGATGNGVSGGSQQGSGMKSGGAALALAVVVL